MAIFYYIKRGLTLLLKTVVSFSVIWIVIQLLSGCKSMSSHPTAIENRMDSAVADVHQTLQPFNNIDSTKKETKVIKKRKAAKAPKRRKDSTITSNNNSKIPKTGSAYLGYAFPPKMTRGETRIFYAYVTVLNNRVIIHQKLESAIQAEEGQDAIQDTIIVYPQDISFYRSICLSLTDPSGDFQINRLHISDTQNIDLRTGNRWQWAIVTQTSKAKANLLLHAQGILSSETSNNIDARLIQIRIAIKDNILRTFFDYLTDNPKVSVPIVVSFFAFIGFLIRFFLKKKTVDATPG